MGGKTIQNIIAEVDGKTIVLDAEKDKIKTETVSTVFCDSPRCAARHDGKTTNLTWIEEKAKEDPFSLPDDFSWLITIKPNPWNMDETILVCSPSCAKDYFTYGYVRAKSPRQLKQESEESLKVNAAAIQAIEEQNPQMTLPFDVSETVND